MLRGLIIIGIAFMMLGCPGIMEGMDTPPIPDIDVVESTAAPGDEITIYSYNYDIFNSDWGGEYELPAIEEVMFDVNTESDEAPSFHGCYIPVHATIEKIDGYTAKVKVPKKAVSGRLFVSHGGLTRKVLEIKYPAKLELDKTCVYIGDIVTITSAKPFFDEDTFSKEKVTKMLNAGYKIVWLANGKFDKVYKNGDELQCDSDLKWNSVAYDGVPKCFYIPDSITPYSVSFKVPPFAKSGYVKVINEGGFSLFESRKAYSCVTPKKDEAAYYMAKSRLVIDDE